jgi:hypothetical protein
MPRKNVTPAPPGEALPEGEPNRYLAKLKSSLVKRWSMTRMETLYEIFDLAAFLWALGRDGEALAVAASVAAAVPAPPPLGDGFMYNVWCPATFSHALVVRLSTGALRSSAEASRAALLRDAGIARTNPDFIAGKVAEARQAAAAGAGQRTVKWECLALARSLGSLVLFLELAKAGDALFEEHSGKAAAMIPQILSKLGALLRGAT